jgi:translocation protein SEC63
MSDKSQSLQDHFFRSEKQELQYDDSAFYIFFISLLTIVLVPYTYYMLKSILFGEIDLNLGGQNCGCTKCVAKRGQRVSKSRRSCFRLGFFFKLACLAGLWYVFMLTFEKVQEIEPVKNFDPYDILEVEVGSDVKKFKSQYRRLSLKYHPDKNPGDPKAHQKFIDLAKAYKTLTDDTARENYEKYGNPDGPGTFKVAIALPKFLLEKDFQIQVLVCFFICLLIVVPAFFFSQLSDQTTEYGV